MLLLKGHEEYENHGKEQDRGNDQEAFGEAVLRVDNLAQERPQSEAKAIGGLKDTEDEVTRGPEFEGRSAVDSIDRHGVPETLDETEDHCQQEEGVTRISVIS